MEVFKLVNGGVMNGTMNASNKGNKGGLPSAVLYCLKAYLVRLCEFIIVCEFNDEYGEGW